MTKLYAFERAGGPLPESLAETLPPWRKERFYAIRNSAGRQESLCAGLLFSYVMRQDGIDPRGPVEILPAGKPVFSGREDVYFSLSHSGAWVLCAISASPVGVDVQQSREVTFSISRRFHPGERAWLSSLSKDERRAGFFRLWTRKEAWVKAVSEDRMLTLSEADVMHGLDGLSFAEYTLPGGFFAAVCAADDTPPRDITVVSERELLP